MKKFFGMIACIVAIASLTSCGNKKVEEKAPVQEPVKEEVYQPKHESQTIDLKGAKKISYYNAPTASPATSVAVNYDQKKPYAAPVEIVYTYANGDTYTYTIPAEFGLWKNSASKFRVITDADGTVWLQGQEKNGKRHEFVFFGDPKHNDAKITPNSYKNTIRYRNKK